MIRLYFLFSCILFSSCTTWQNKAADPVDAIRGDWLILYPDHELSSENQRKVYTKAQDSIVGLFGLKMISFNADRTFVQTDSIFNAPGKWHFDPAGKKLFIRDAGRGFEFFKGTFLGIERDTMLVSEIISLEGEQVKLTWYLKRIDDKKRSALFSAAENGWRKRHATAINEELEKKIKAMLTYYSLYYEMVSKESAYFSQSRVFLPFMYYQHSMRLKPFNENSDFSLLFYDKQQALRGYRILETAMDKLKNERFPSGENFVIEYARFLKQLAEVI